jgi:hypothetical protein
MMGMNWKRSLRRWRQEFRSVWCRLTAFHRIVLGILLALVAAYVGRQKMMDPLEVQVRELRESLQKQSVPSQVPAPEKDAQTQAALQQAEKAGRNIKDLLKQVRAAEQASALRLDASQTEAGAWVVERATQCGLRIRDNHDVETGLLYEMQGRFESVYRLLSAMDRAPFIWSVSELMIELEELEHKKAEELVNVSPLLSLRFVLQFQPYQREGR